MAGKRRTKLQIKRQQKRTMKEAAMAKGISAKGNSKYAKKNRPKEISQGYSTRPTSPFYLPESQRGGIVPQSSDAV